MMCRTARLMGAPLRARRCGCPPSHGRSTRVRRSELQWAAERRALWRAYGRPGQVNGPALFLPEQLSGVEPQQPSGDEA